jgi:CheY-like chemotaxis protein
MDCQMPVMNGLEATTAIRNLDELRVSRVPVVAVSSGVKSMNQQACLEAGMDDYVSKPLNQVVLTDVLVRNLPPKLLGHDEANGRLDY